MRRFIVQGVGQGAMRLDPWFSFNSHVGILVLALLASNIAAPSAKTIPPPPVYDSFWVRFLEVNCEPSDSKAYAACFAFVEGVLEGADLERTREKNPPTFCIPASISPWQKVDAVRDYVKVHPGQSGHYAREFVIDAASAAWPCPHG